MHRILFVDDDEDICLVGEKSLSRLGYITVTAHSGNDAREVLEKDDFDILITDLHMDNGGGQQLIDWCLENKSDMKLLAVSGEDLDVTISALDMVGDKGVPTMEKPYEMKQLAEIIDGIIGNQFH